MPPTDTAPATPDVLSARPGSLRAAALALTAVGAVGLAVAAAFFTAHLFRPSPPPRAGGEEQEAGNEQRLFEGWPKPELVIVLTGQQHGYLLPCGCTRPQKGGLERRYNFLQELRRRGWPVVAADLGDVAQREGPQALPNVQGLLKYTTSMKALQKMGYTAVAVGEYERLMPLSKALDAFALNDKSPRVLAANVTNRDDFPDELASWQMAEVKGTDVKVAVAGTVGKSVVKAVDDAAKVKFADNGEALKGVLKELAARKAELRVLLYQGTPDEAREAAKAFPEFQVVQCLSREDEPSSKPEAQGDTLVVGVGHKGKYVGVVGVFRGKKPGTFDLRYQLAEMSESYETPKGKEKDNPVLQLMEGYTQELKAGNYLTKYGQVPHPVQVQFPGAEYVGSAECAACHKSAHDVWKKSAHAHAYQTLVDATRPSLRQFDGECVVCHVTGFGHKTGFTDAKNPMFPKLKDVTCESCHGPASKHLDNVEDLKVRAALNPWKAKADETAEQKKRRLGQVNQFCQKCHDIDNDVHWNFEKKWPQVAHPNPKK